MMHSRLLFAALAALVASTSLTRSAGAEYASDARTTQTVDAEADAGRNADVLVELMSTFLPAELDGNSFAPLASMVATFSTGDVARGLVEWRSFVKSHAKELGSENIARIGVWLVRAAIVEPNSELADAADRVRFAREGTSRLRVALGELEAAQQAMSATKRVAVRTVVVLPYERSQPATRDFLAAPTTKAELDAEVERVKDQLDSLSEMGEMESLRLQMAMDRMSKMMSTLSNLMKKLSDTASTIVQNIK